MVFFSVQLNTKWHEGEEIKLEQRDKHHIEPLANHFLFAECKNFMAKTVGEKHIYSNNNNQLHLF